MKVIIETDETDLASIYFKENENLKDWVDISRDDQIKILNTMLQFTNLFNKFIKQ